MRQTALRKCLSMIVLFIHSHLQRCNEPRSPDKILFFLRSLSYKQSYLIPVASHGCARMLSMSTGSPQDPDSRNK